MGWPHLGIWESLSVLRCTSLNVLQVLKAYVNIDCIFRHLNMGIIVNSYQIYESPSIFSSAGMNQNVLQVLKDWSNQISNKTVAWW